jgi:hypothetical protein
MTGFSNRWNHRNSYIVEALRRSRMPALAAAVAVGVFFFASCGVMKSSTTDSIGENLSADDGLLQGYVSACEEALSSDGRPVVIPAMDCSSNRLSAIGTGLESPLTHMGAMAGEGKQADPLGPKRCHTPSALLGAYPLAEGSDDNPCMQGSRIGRQDDGDVTWVTVCRKYRHYEDPFLFDDVNMIGYNRKTGKTCFFNSKVTGETTKQPLRFNRPVNVKSPQADKVFMSPAQIQAKVPCASCHAANPFLRTPHIRAAVELPAMERNTPYQIVWPEYFTPDGSRVANLRLDPEAVPEIRSCVGCHAVGAGKYCSVYAPLAWGLKDESLVYWQYASEKAASLPDALWHAEVLPRLKEVKTVEGLGRLPLVGAVAKMAQFCRY